MSKLKEEELLEWLHGHIPDGWKVHSAYEQVVALIKNRAEQEEIELTYIDIVIDLCDQLQQKKPKVTENWIEEKAKEFMSDFGVRGKTMISYVKDFIRSLA